MVRKYPDGWRFSGTKLHFFTGKKDKRFGVARSICKKVSEYSGVSVKKLNDVAKKYPESRCFYCVRILKNG